ncbi:DUF4365 domain-containing protein [Rhodococcus aetherivorans]
MARRANQNERTGNAGVAAVDYQLTKMGWQPYRTSQGELGIDLLIEARDDGLFDYGLMIAAQVKTGPSQFKPKKDHTGQIVGWWFEDTKGEHLPYWRDHVLPTILILHDEDTETSYWVHVTADSIQSTGLGMKILVPKDSTIDLDHVDALMDVAASGRPASIWEGSAWNSHAPIGRVNRLRYALLTPRLVAPHPNLGVNKATPFEAIALLVKMRLRPLQPPLPGREAAVPDLDTCRTSSEWLWRLYAALYDVLVDGKDIDAVRNLIEATSKPHERAAASAIVCALHVENQDPRAGLVIIEQALDTADDYYTPADRYWLLVHKARCLTELGELDPASKLAIEVQRLRTLEPNDPTATAIAGAGTDIIFNVSGWRSDLSGVIAGRDTLAAWWRSQEISSGLQQHFDDHFRNWATHTAAIRGDGETWFRLRAASLIAGMTAEHSAWRHASALLAKHILTFETASSDADKTTTALTALRRAGDSKALELAVKRLLDAGPASAAQDAAAEVDLNTSTRTSLPADLKLLAAAADVLDHNTADRTCRWILSNLADLDGFVERFQPIFSADHALLETLTRLVPALSDTTLRELIDHILSLPSNGDVGWGHDWARIVQAIPSTAWTPDDRVALAARDNDDSELRHAISTVVAEGSSSHRDRLRAEIREGNLDALESFGDVRDLDPETVEGLCDHLGRRIDSMITDMGRGTFRISAHDIGATLVLINVWHRDHARWEPVRKLLTFSASTWMTYLSGMLTHLRRLADHIPDDIRVTLVGPLRTLMLTGVSDHLVKEDVRGLAAGALAAIDPDSITDTELWELMCGPTREHKEAAIRVIAARGLDRAVDTLWSLSRDKDPWIRAIVVNQLTFASSQHDDPRLSALLERLLDDHGTLTARMAAIALRDAPRSEPGDRLAEQLRNHISAQVRRYVAKYEAEEMQTAH